MYKFSANLSMLFTEYEFMQRFEAAAKSGFEGVEYLFPYDFSHSAIANELTKHKLTQVLFNLPCGDWNAGERGIACHPDRIDEFRSGVAQAIEYAHALNCKKVNCLAGKKPSTVSEEDAYRTLVDNLRFAAEELKTAGIALVFEAINTIDIPEFFINSTKQAKKIQNDVDSSNLTLQYDIYHMQIMEGDLSRTIEQNLSIIGHLQLADNPGRHEPGTGEINYSFLFKHLESISYKGWVGCEYIPKTNTLDGLGWIEKYV
ncbi:hydroxypyruvate isomerase [Vibrio sp. TH_r3]|uniref:hydroxypyruvate isomerase n=1 Tax=Vibrio sp. TH_r3 TaxID=3082084 RepID=UPI002953339A|nr:hydroxypyruvate isomerase [Vibrio sp. TH_r3]MDV7105359.1 hydroxypyruvate isomerase [Vibrio sp. TH_r3]